MMIYQSSWIQVMTGLWNELESKNVVLFQRIHHEGTASMGVRAAEQAIERAGIHKG